VFGVQWRAAGFKSRRPEQFNQLETGSTPDLPSSPFRVAFVAVRFQNVNRPATWMRRGP
jgi:hypothetical protein